jgi:DNA-binding NarL/FixJ family response regulator
MTNIKSAKKEKNKIRVFIVDDHVMLRQGLKTSINGQLDMVACGEADSRDTALQGIEHENPDVALVDLSLKNSNGLELIKDLRIRCPNVRLLVLSMHNESFYAERVLRAGAMGYITKDEAADRLIGGIRHVYAGKPWLSESVSDRIITKSMGGIPRQEAASPDCLSDRELEVLEYIGKGFASGEIAEKLKLSVKTIESHREHIKEKLDLKNAPQLVKYAFHWVHNQKSQE